MRVGAEARASARGRGHDAPAASLTIAEILPDGEETVYGVKFGILSVGEVTYRVAHVEDAGVPMLRLESQTQASAWLSAFLKIGGVMRSYVDRDVAPAVELLVDHGREGRSVDPHRQLRPRDREWCTRRPISRSASRRG